MKISPILLAVGILNASAAYTLPENYQSHNVSTPEEIAQRMNAEAKVPMAFLLSGDTEWKNQETGPLIVSPASGTTQADTFVITSGDSAKPADFSYTGNSTGLLYMSVCELTAANTNNFYAGLEGLGNVTISRNTANTKAATTTSDGYKAIAGVLAAGDRTILSISQNSGAVNISSNIVQANDMVKGGAVFLYNSSQLQVNDNAGSVTISGNTAASSKDNSSYSAQGGAIFADYQNGSLSISRNQGDITIDGNTVSGYVNLAAMGGAIYVARNINLDDNSGAVRFSNNKALVTTEGNYKTGQAKGGAIYSTNAEASISNNAGGVEFSGNYAEIVSGSAAAGAVSMTGGTLLINNNTGYVNISGNHAIANANTAYGGAMEVKTLTISNTRAGANPSAGLGSVTISDNYARSSGNTAQGGAYKGTTLTISDNAGRIQIQRNHATHDGTGTSTTYGGAVYAPTVNIIGNGENVNISGNYTDNTNGLSHGGAIYAGTAINIKDNAGSVSISDNHSKSETNNTWGGAIYGKNIEITGNQTVDILNNHADLTGTPRTATTYARGGAIYSTGSVIIAHNGNTTLAGNYERMGETYRLRSIYQTTTTAGTTLQLGADADKQLIIKDSIYAKNAAGTVINGTYTDAAGKEHQQTGTVIFSGKDTVSLLQAAKNSDDISDDEISSSRTSEFASGITLSNGTLSIEDGARLETTSFAIENGAALQLKNGGTLSTAQSDELLFGEGTQILVQGVNNTIAAANLSFADGVTLTFDLGAELDTTTFNLRSTPGALLTLAADTLTLGDSITLNLINAGDANMGEYQLLDFGTGLTEEQMKEIEQKFTFTVDGAEADFSFADGKVFANVTAPVVPEPTTTTLGLLALCGLAARRRRKA